MSHYQYLIIGGGMTADAAVRGIREVDTEGTIGLISAEADPPYARPPLSKKLWAGEELEHIWRRTEELGVEFHLDRTVRELHPGDRLVRDDQGRLYTFDKLLLATGARPRRLSQGSEHVIYFRTLADYRKLRSLTEQGQRFAVIGAGFIGTEIASALIQNKKEVTLVFPEEVLGERIFPKDLGMFLNDFYREKGVEVWAGETIRNIERHDRGFTLFTHNPSTLIERELTVDGIVAGIGVEPNIELARMGSLEVVNGIWVDEFLRTSHPDIYAAGDVAAFFNSALRERLRVEHEDNANTMGLCAGRSMAGEVKPYRHQPFFYSDLFELGYEAVGKVDVRLETVADWNHPYREGVIYYLHQGRVRGVLLWNVWQQVETARRLIAEPGPFWPKDLIGKIPTAR